MKYKEETSAASTDMYTVSILTKMDIFYHHIDDMESLSYILPNLAFLKASNGFNERFSFTKFDITFVAN